MVTYCKQKNDRFVLYFNSSLVGQDIEDVHQLRVTIKELRSIWTLVEWTSDKAYSKEQHYANITPLFKSAGNLREAQVNYSLVKNLKANYIQHYKNHLLELEENCIVHLLVAMKSFDMKRFSTHNKSLYKTASQFEEQDIRRNIAKLISHKLKKVELLRELLPNDKKLHKIRVHLKVVKEMFQIMNELELTKGLEQLRKQNISICKYLGLWHDQVVLLESVKTFDKKGLNHRELSYYTTFINRVAQKENLRKQLVLEKLNSYINAHQSKALVSASK